MRGVVAAAGERDEPEVALDHDDLGIGGNGGDAEAGRDLALGHRAVAGERRVFRMLDDQQAEAFGVAQRTAHHQAAGDRPGRVREAERAGLGEQAHLGHLFALEAARDRAVAAHVDPVALPAPAGR